MIGKESKKIINFAVRSKSCRVCQHARRKGVPARVHNCRKNWQGSAKAMEPDMVTDMVKQMKTGEVKIGTLIGDDDATTIARARDFDPGLQKLSDRNHVRKTLSNELYKVKARHGRNLQVKAISYLQKCFTYAIDQNRSKPETLAQNLRAIVPHAFGDHGRCRANSLSWCQSDGTRSHQYKSLPNGRCLTGDCLRSDLEEVFDNLAQSAGKLSMLESSQANENFNNIAASKAPKTRYYCGSESLAYRISAAVSQKNIGHTYMTKVTIEGILFLIGESFGNCQLVSSLKYWGRGKL